MITEKDPQMRLIPACLVVKRITHGPGRAGGCEGDTPELTARDRCPCPAAQRTAYRAGSAADTGTRRHHGKSEQRHTHSRNQLTFPHC
jgi:hypothetical protein